MSRKEFSRRTFIFGTAIGAASLSLPGRAYARKKKSANDTIHIASIGAGGKAREDIHRSKSEGEIVALCDADWRRAARTFTEFEDAKQFYDFRRMFDKMHKDIDAVIVTTPDHFHAVAALAAMQLGKHVYVQKPLTYSIGEARILQKAAHDNGVTTQMGNQGHCRDGVRQLSEMIWNGDLGQVTEVHMWTNRPIWPQGIPFPTEEARIPDKLNWDVWQGPAEERPYHHSYLPFDWRGWGPYGCGALGDMACHIADPANAALKLGEVGPTSVEVLEVEGLNDASYPTKSKIKYEFPARGDMDPVTVYWYDGGLLPERPEGLSEDTLLGEGDNGSLFIGTKAMATCGTYSDKPRLVPDEKMLDYTWPEETLPRMEQQSPYIDWLQSARAGRQAQSNFDYAAPFTEWVLLGNIGLKFPKEKLEWDAKNMRVTNRDEANEFVMRKYRAGWELSV